MAPPETCLAKTCGGALQEHEIKGYKCLKCTLKAHHWVFRVKTVEGFEWYYTTRGLNPTLAAGINVQPTFDDESSPPPLDSLIAKSTGAVMLESKNCSDPAGHRFSKKWLSVLYKWFSYVLVDVRINQFPGLLDAISVGLRRMVTLETNKLQPILLFPHLQTQLVHIDVPGGSWGVLKDAYRDS